MTMPQPNSAPYLIAPLYAKQPRNAGLSKTQRGLPASAASASVASSSTSEAAAVIAATATKIASRSVFHRARLIYGERASAEVLPIPHLNRLLCILIGCHFDESQTLRAAAHLIHDDDGGLDGSALRESVFELSVGRAVGQPADV